LPDWSAEKAEADDVVTSTAFILDTLRDSPSALAEASRKAQVSLRIAELRAKIAPLEAQIAAYNAEIAEIELREGT